MNYPILIYGAYKSALNESKQINPEPIGNVIQGGKVIDNVSQGFFGKGALLLKKRNRKFCQAMIEFCETNKIYYSYSDYHNAYRIKMCKSNEYERMQAFYDEFIDYCSKHGIETLHVFLELD